MDESRVSLSHPITRQSFRASCKNSDEVMNDVYLADECRRLEATLAEQKKEMDLLKRQNHGRSALLNFVGEDRMPKTTGKLRKTSARLEALLHRFFHGWMLSLLMILTLNQ